MPLMIPRPASGWMPPDDDEYTYVKRNGRWVRLDADEDDDLDLDEFEEKRREHIARANEY